MSHCFLMQTPAYPRPFIITDAAINIAPTLQDKADIVRNAVDLAHAFGIARPRVAILAAVETVNPNMPATLDAAALCKMADRGQIEGAHRRRAAGVRQRRLGRRRAHQGHRLRGGRRRRHPGRSRPRERQHAGQATRVPGRRCKRRHRRRRARSDRADQPRGPARGAHRLVRGCAGRCAARCGAAATGAGPSRMRRLGGGAPLSAPATRSCMHERRQAAPRRCGRSAAQRAASLDAQDASEPILVLNCGSSSIKFALFDANVLPRTAQAALVRQGRGHRRHQCAA